MQSSLLSGSCASPQCSRKLKWILLSFPKGNLLTVCAKQKALPYWTSHHTSLSWVDVNSQSPRWAFTSENGLSESQWQWGHGKDSPNDSFQWRPRVAARNGKSEVEQGSEGLKGDQYKIQMQHGTTPIGWSFCHKVKEFLCPLSPATHLFFFTQILQESISGRRCHGLWRKDRFLKNQYFDRNHVWLYGEWEHHLKTLRI